MVLAHLKDACAGCERMGLSMSKEHIWPVWLIRRTSTDKTGVRWIDKPKVPALAVTVPLCHECNSTFGRELEAPVSALFDDLESGKGITDLEADLLVRWLWKIAGLFWIAAHPTGDYTKGLTLRQRVLVPITGIRGDLTLAIALIERVDPQYGDAPLGLDHTSRLNAVFVSGVLSRLALMVVQEPLAPLIPSAFTQYRLLPVPDATSAAKLCHPKVGFSTCTDAVGVTIEASRELSIAHDRLAIEMQQYVRNDNID